MSRITKIEEPMEGLVHLHFENQYDVTSTFMRMQEFYESPYENIKGKFFTVEEYMDTYADDTGNFTYTSDWSGFNVPGNVVVDFFGLFYKNSTCKEQELFDALVPYRQKYGRKFYVIGTYKEDTIDHEIAHALYYLNPAYKSMMDNFTIGLSSGSYSDFRDALLNLGYCREVISDEMQAYLATSSYWYLFKRFNTINFPWLSVKTYREGFKSFRENHCG